jgi:hypothetical protein
VLLLAGCKKGFGEHCEQSWECGEGLTCVTRPPPPGSVGEEPTQTCLRENFDGATCTCGCNRSPELIAELRKMEPRQAERVIGRKLAIIDAQARAGHLTEKMIAHRQRLLALRQELHP